MRGRGRAPSPNIHRMDRRRHPLWRLADRKSATSASFSSCRRRRSRSNARLGCSRISFAREHPRVRTSPRRMPASNTQKAAARPAPLSWRRVPAPRRRLPNIQPAQLEMLDDRLGQRPRRLDRQVRAFGREQASVPADRIGYRRDQLVARQRLHAPNIARNGERTNAMCGRYQTSSQASSSGA
jgi:hypothetical protein